MESRAFWCFASGATSCGETDKRRWVFHQMGCGHSQTHIIRSSTSTSVTATFQFPPPVLSSPRLRSSIHARAPDPRLPPG